MNSTFSFNDGIDWVKQFWEGFSGNNGLPSMMTPTLDLKEIEQRINDLKTVEHWLNINLNLLRTTIQGLEVQHGTLATLQSFGASMTTPVKQPTATIQPSHTNKSVPEKNQTASAEASEKTTSPETLNNGLNPSLWWNLLQQQFQQMTQQVLQEPPQPMKSNAESKSTVRAKPGKPVRRTKKVATQSNPAPKTSRKAD